MSRPWLPNLLREMADRFDLPTALRFAERFGGRHVYLPLRVEPEHPVARAMGHDVLEWLIGQHERLERVLVPKGPNSDRAALKQEITELMSRGATNDEIAEKTGLHRRSVQNWKARLDRELLGDRQPGLFD